MSHFILVYFPRVLALNFHSHLSTPLVQKGFFHGGFYLGLVTSFRLPCCLSCHEDFLSSLKSYRPHMVNHRPYPSSCLLLLPFRSPLWLFYTWQKSYGGQRHTHNTFLCLAPLVNQVFLWGHRDRHDGEEREENHLTTRRRGRDSYTSFSVDGRKSVLKCRYRYH